MEIQEIEELKQIKNFEKKTGSPEIDSLISSVSGTKKPEKRKMWIFAVLGIIGIGAGLLYYRYCSAYVSTDDAFIEGHIIRVSPRVQGTVKKVFVVDNQKVNKGDLLFEIDPQDYQLKYDLGLARFAAAQEKHKSACANLELISITSRAAVDEANSAVEGARAGIEIAEKQIAQAKSNLEQINADIESVKAELEFAQKELNRYQQLSDRKIISDHDFDSVKTKHKTAQARLNSYLQRASSAQSALQSAYSSKEVSEKALNQAIGRMKAADTVKEQVSISKAQQKIAEAELNQCTASLKQAELDLSYTKVIAPQSGSVTSKSVEEGAYIHVGQPVLSIVPEDNWVIANFKETQLTDMRIGQHVSIKLDTYPGKEFKGHVESIQSSTGSKMSLFPPENAVGSFVKVVQRIPVKIVFDEKPRRNLIIVPGMSVVPEVRIR